MAGRYRNMNSEEPSQVAASDVLAPPKENQQWMADDWDLRRDFRPHFSREIGERVPGQEVPAETEP